MSTVTGFSYLNQLQQLYSGSKPYQGTSFNDFIISGNGSVKTSNDTGAVAEAGKTEDSTSLSADALKALQQLAANNQDTGAISKILGGSGTDDPISELFGNSLLADPLSKSLLLDSYAQVKNAGNSLIQQEKQAANLANDPIQKVLKAYQDYQNIGKTTGIQVDEVA